jgi:galactose mutarotase-like enzyme
MSSIENQHLKVLIHPKGAELQSIFNKDLQLEYLWNGDPAFWTKRSPVLFPIVGTLKNNTYFYNNTAYELGRHGFAREMEFEKEGQQFDAIGFLLKSNKGTLQHFPFAFEFRIHYLLEGYDLKTTYSIKNLSAGEMYFSVGGHPAFNLPLVEGTDYSDYYLEFNETETSPRWPISKDGLIEKEPEPLLQDTTVLPLSKELFFKDALVFKYPASSLVSLKSDKTAHGLDFDFSGFPYLGIWAAKNANFVCIEPWCGISDPVDTDQQFVHKEGIQQLAAGGIFERSWKVSFF